MKYCILFLILFVACSVFAGSTPIFVYDNVENPQYLSYIAEKDCDYVIVYNPYQSTSANLAEIEDYLDDASTEGLKVILGIYRWDVFQNDTTDLYTLLNYNSGAIKNHSALQGWYLADEPIWGHHNGESWNLTYCENFYDIINSESGKPVFMAFYDYDGSKSTNNDWDMVDWKDAYDVAIVDRYLSFEDDYEFASYSVECTTNWSDIESYANTAGRDLWMVFQGYGEQSDGSYDNRRLSSYNEHRYLTFRSMMFDVKAVGIWCYYRALDSIASTDQQYNVYLYDGVTWLNDGTNGVWESVNHEFQDWDDAFADGMIGSESSDGYIKGQLFKKPNGRYCFLTANTWYTNYTNKSLTVNVPGRDVLWATPMYENSSGWSISNNTITDDWLKYEIHLYNLAACFIENRDFESGNPPSNWSGYSGAAISRDSSVKTTGNYSCKVYSRDYWYSGMQQDIKSDLLTDGEGSYFIRAYVRMASGSDTAKIMIAYQDSNGWHYATKTATVNSSGWTYISGDVNVNWTGTLSNAYFKVRTDTTADYYVDSVQCYKK